MINTEASQVLVEYSKHIARWAKQGDKPNDKRTPAQARAGENAWRLLHTFLKFGEHVKESDHYWLLVRRAQESGASAKEQNRLFAIAEAEDRGYMSVKRELEEMLAEMLQRERDDPKALETGVAKAVKTAKPVAKKASEAVKSKTAAKTSSKATKAPVKAATKKVASSKKPTAAKRAVASTKSTAAKKS